MLIQIGKSYCNVIRAACLLAVSSTLSQLSEEDELWWPVSLAQPQMLVLAAYTRRYLGIHVDSSLPVADVTMQLLQPLTKFAFRTVNVHLCQATFTIFSSPSHGSGMELGLDVASLGVGLVACQHQ